LVVDTHKTITNGETIELKFKTALLNDVSRDSGDIVAGIRFTGDVEISSLELGE
jgi:hypothetical protein